MDLTNLVLLEDIDYWVAKCASLQQEVDVLNEKLANASIIHWQTGEPKERGVYLVTLLNGKVRVADFYQYKVADKEYWNCIPYNIVCVKAWCKLSDIKPYKEE